MAKLGFGFYILSWCVGKHPWHLHISTVHGDDVSEFSYRNLLTIVYKTLFLSRWAGGKRHGHPKVDVETGV